MNINFYKYTMNKRKIKRTKTQQELKNDNKHNLEATEDQSNNLSVD